MSTSSDRSPDADAGGERERIRRLVLDVLAGIAPEADLGAVPPGANIRRELDLDSVDFQTFLIRVAQGAGVDIADRDAGTLTTLEACVDYVVRRTAAARGRA